jgi:hypothetical protein
MPSKFFVPEIQAGLRRNCSFVEFLQLCHEHHPPEAGHDRTKTVVNCEVCKIIAEIAELCEVCGKPFGKAERSWGLPHC